MKEECCRIGSVEEGAWLGKEGVEEEECVEEQECKRIIYTKLARELTPRHPLPFHRIFKLNPG